MAGCVTLSLAMECLSWKFIHANDIGAGVMKTTTAARYRQTAVTCVLLTTLQPLPVSLGVKSEINYELNEIRNITDFF